MILEEDSEEEREPKKTEFVPGSLVLAKVTTTDISGDRNGKAQEGGKEVAFDPKGPLFKHKKKERRE